MLAVWGDSFGAQSLPLGRQRGSSKGTTQRVVIVDKDVFYGNSERGDGFHIIQLNLIKLKKEMDTLKR